jgi:hypothetical protein
MTGRAQFGFGDGDETTPVANDPARATTYFRRTFIVDDARKYRTLTVRLLRDDGAVVWLNGAELLRSNMPATGEITWATSATSDLSGSDESTFVTYTFDARKLRTGANVLAMDVHQFGRASEDLSFDLELTASRDFASTLISSGSVWKYRDNGIPPSADWTATAYNDTAWAAGPARLGYGGDGEATTLSFGGNPQNRYLTTWLRRAFTVTDARLFDALKIDLQRDDGAVVYLNGVEVLRDNLPSQTVTPSTRATSDIAGPDELAWQTFIVPSSALRSGANVLAVEVHQAASDSTDLGIDLRLSGIAQSSIGYSQWQATAFGSDRSNSIVAGEAADPDSDTFSNLTEYALGGRPTFGSEGPLAVGDAASGRLALQFARNALAADVTLTVQAADDLAGPWVDLARSTGGDPFDPVTAGVTILELTVGALRAVEVRDIFQMTDPGHPQRFLRLKLSK